jgi:nitrite reductase/ring-hydroxylating ferredoxin subunit/uncharacterized membrane protein
LRKERIMPEQIDAIAAALETQNWLQPLESGLQDALTNVFAQDGARGKPIENALHGLWLGHALHPVLTDVPAGAWTVTFVLDLVQDLGGSSRYEAGADAAMTIGMVGAGAAAVTGLTDWKDIERKSRRTGLVHAMLNTLALSLYIGSAIQRSRRKQGSARALRYMAYGVTMGSAWLGGHLSYNNQIGVARLPQQQPPARPAAVLSASELMESEPRRVDCAGYPVVLVKQGGQIYALTDTCTHAGGSLAEGKVEADCIRCPLHGSLFSLRTGEVVEGPSVYPVLPLQAVVREGHVEVSSPLPPVA